MGSNTFGDIASLATGGGGLDQGAAVTFDATTHAASSLVGQVAVGTATSIATPVSHITAGTPVGSLTGVYNPVSAAQTTVRIANTPLGKFGLSAAEGLLAVKMVIDAGVYVGALVVCSKQ